jgi:hypothetical protein
MGPRNFEGLTDEELKQVQSLVDIDWDSGDEERAAVNQSLKTKIDDEWAARAAATA